MGKLEEVNGKAKKKLASKVVTKIDTEAVDVLQWAKEGRELYFGDNEEFLKLPTEAYKALSLDSKRRYDIAEGHTLGRDIVKDSIPEAFNLPFNVRPESVNRQLSVLDQDPKLDYHWGRPEKIGQHQSEGWVVDLESSAHTEFQDSSSYTTVGGQNRPEMILLTRSKEVSAEKRKERKDLRDASVRKTQGQFKEAASELGVKAIVDA